MGFNFGAFAGGAANGYSQGIEDQAKKNDADWKEKERLRIESDRKIDEDVNKQTSAYMKDKLTQQSSIKNATVQESAPVISNTASNGIGIPPSATNDNATQPSTPMAQEINLGGQPAQPIPDASAPKYRTPDVNDMLDVAKHRTDLFMQAGHFDKATAAHKDYLAFAAEKLQSEQQQRADLARKTIPGILTGNYSGLGAFYDMMPDGNKLGNVVQNKDGTVDVTVVSKDGQQRPPVKFQDNSHLANAVMSMVDSKFALENLDKQGQLEIKKAELEQTSKHQNETAVETARHNKADESTNRIKADADTVKAAKSGIKPYKVEGSEVATVLGDPAVDKNGKPVVDIMSGRQIVNRNATREDAFYKWMAQNGITDTNEGLAKYKGNPPAPPPAQPIANLPQGAKQVGTSGGKPVFQTPDGKRFVGG